LITAVIAGSANAASPSFECTNLATKVEKLICANANLADLDGRLAAYYEGARRRIAESVECLRTDQEEWLHSIRDQCADVDCLRRAYLDRLAVLEGVQPPSIEKVQLPKQPPLAAIIPPNGDAPSIPREPSTRVEVEGRYALNDDYGLTLTDEASHLFVLAGLLNQEVPLELAALEQARTPILARGWLLARKPTSAEYPNLARPFGVFDPHECIYVYRSIAVRTTP
jgi:uncharacterized protein